MMRALALLLVLLGLQGCSALDARRPLGRTFECECCAPLGPTPTRGRAAAKFTPKPFELQGTTTYGD
jgi:hypothetical protein